MAPGWVIGGFSVRHCQAAITPPVASICPGTGFKTLDAEPDMPIKSWTMVGERALSCRRLIGAESAQPGEHKAIVEAKDRSASPCSKPRRNSLHARNAIFERNLFQRQCRNVPCDMRCKLHNSLVCHLEINALERPTLRMLENRGCGFCPVQFKHVIRKAETARLWRMKKAHARIKPHADDCPRALPTRNGIRIIEHCAKRRCRVPCSANAAFPFQQIAGPRNEQPPM